MNSIIRIKRKPLKAVTEKELLLYVNNLLQRCAAVSDLAVVQPQLAAVQTAADLFSERLEAAVAGGRDRVALKNLAKTGLTEKLELLFRAVDHALLPQEVLVRAGFEFVGDRRTSASDELPRPVVRAVTPLGEGAVRVDFRVEAPTRVRANAFEWSADDGATWHNGTYGTRTGVRIAGLPRRQEALVRMCSIGARGRRSDWTEGMPVFVL